MNAYVTQLISKLKLSPDLRKHDFGSWTHCEQGLGFLIPESYKDLFARIGDGQWGGLMSMHPPDTIAQCNFGRWGDRYGPDFPQFSFYPVIPGLFPWGFTGSRTTLFWLICQEKLEEWPIVILDPGFEPEIWNMSVPEFLWKHLTGELRSSLYPGNLVSNPTVVPL